MMMYKLSLEVPGSIGDKSIIEYDKGMIKDVKHLKYVFEGWFGDELLTTSPCYFITEELSECLFKNRLTGFNCNKNIEIIKSEIFRHYHPNIVLPIFLLMKIDGVVEIREDKISKWSGHDFCLYRNVMLYVTENALEILKNSGRMKNFEYTGMEFII